MAIDTREELVNNLTEAAELEHGLLCQYLFAAFSMKTHPHEGLTWPQAERVRGWEAQILAVAREEMAHLGTVCNLLTAIGAAPRFGRPNFPQPAHYFPSPTGEAAVAFTLEPFSPATVKRFIRFESPKEALEGSRRAIAPEPIAYKTVGDLYRQVAEGFRTIDERSLFIGPTAAQDTDDWSASLRLRNVVDRATALRAIDFIIEEGEAPPTPAPADSHYERFLQVYAGLMDETGRSPHFAPARPVVSNPLTQWHRDAQGGTLLTDPGAREVAELFNAVYGTVILMLLQFYAFAEESAEQREGLRASIRQAMSGIIRPLGELLTQLPAGADHPEQVAGPGFELYADLRLPRHTRTAWTIFHERLVHEAEACRALSRQPGAPPRLRYLHETLHLLARNIGRLMSLKGL